MEATSVCVGYLQLKSCENDSFTLAERMRERAQERGLRLCAWRCEAPPPEHEYTHPMHYTRLAAILRIARSMQTRVIITNVPEFLRLDLYGIAAGLKAFEIIPLEPEEDDGDFIPSTEAARLLGIHRRTINKYIDAGKIEAKRKGARWLVNPATLSQKTG